MAERLRPVTIRDEILDKVRTMYRVTASYDDRRMELLLRKAKAGYQLNADERLELFDANTKWLNELQAEQLRKAHSNGTRVTRQTRGWTREDLYAD